MRTGLGAGVVLTSHKGDKLKYALQIHFAASNNIAEYEALCNAPDPMRQVSASYSPSLPCHVLVCCTLPCHHMHFISCHHVHFILHTCSSHASEHFPRCPFCNPALLCSPTFLFRLSL